MSAHAQALVESLTRARVQMKFAIAALSLALSLGLLLTGCESRSSALPAAPSGPPLRAPDSPTAGPAQIAVAGERWNLTTTLTSLEGPEVCWAPRTNVGTSVQWLMAIQRDGTSIHLLYDVRNWPTDAVEHFGTVEGDTFEAASRSWTTSLLCGAARSEYQFEAHVSGRFSADGRSLTATEVWSYRPTSGATIRFHFDWTATQQ